LSKLIWGYNSGKNTEDIFGRRACPRREARRLSWSMSEYTRQGKSKEGKISKGKGSTSTAREKGATGVGRFGRVDSYPRQR